MQQSLLIKEPKGLRTLLHIVRVPPWYTELSLNVYST